MRWRASAARCPCGPRGRSTRPASACESCTASSDRVQRPLPLLRPVRSVTCCPITNRARAGMTRRAPRAAGKPVAAAFRSTRSRPLVPHRFSAGWPALPESDGGRQTRTGGNAVYPLSFLVLSTVARATCPKPNLTVRYHAGLATRFCASASNSSAAASACRLQHDEVIIPRFWTGRRREDAFKYSASAAWWWTCRQVGLPLLRMSFLNFTKTLMMRENDGVEWTRRARVSGDGAFFGMERLWT